MMDWLTEPETELLLERMRLWFRGLQMDWWWWFLVGFLAGAATNCG